MIPWFIVNLIGAIASVFGYDVYVRAWSGDWWGAERVYFMPRVAGAQKLRRLAPWNGGPLMAAPAVASGGVVLTAGIDVADDRIEAEVVAWTGRMPPPDRMGPS